MKALMVLLVLIRAAACFAQQSDFRGNVFGSFGMAAVHDNNGFLGSGIDFGVGGGYKITRHIELQIEIDRVDFSRDFSSGVRFEGSVLTFCGNTKFYFTSGKVQPYFFGGIVNVHVEQRNIFPEQIFESRNDSIAIQWGGGFRFLVNPRVSLRPEFRWTINTRWENQLRGSILLGYHF